MRSWNRKTPQGTWCQGIDPGEGSFEFVPLKRAILLRIENDHQCRVSRVVPRAKCGLAVHSGGETSPVRVMDCGEGSFLMHSSISR